MKLIQQVPGDDGNARIYLQMEDGRKLPLPYQWRVEEFTLQGNFKKFSDLLFAVYDESTRTGAFYIGTADTPYWLIWQPCTRALFFDDIAPGWLATAESWPAAKS